MSVRFVGFCVYTIIISLNSINQMSAMEELKVFFAMSTEFLNIIQTNYGFEALKQIHVNKFH
jgi:fumarate reductase subunit C